MSKKIVRAKRIIDVSQGGTHATAKDAIRWNADCIEPSDFSPSYDLPNPFKACMRIRFVRLDGKVVTRKVLMTADWSGGMIEFDAFGSEIYSPPEVTFR